MLTKKLAPCLKRFSIFQLTKCHQKTSVFTKCPRDPQKWTIAPALLRNNNYAHSFIRNNRDSIIRPRIWPRLRLHTNWSRLGHGRAAAETTSEAGPKAASHLAAHFEFCAFTHKPGRGSATARPRPTAVCKRGLRSCIRVLVLEYQCKTY